MGLFSKPEVVIAKESSNAKEYLRQLEELAEKATGENAKKIAKEIAVVKAGIIGEDNILFELKNSGMDMVVLHDLYIESVSGASAQIDFLVLTPKINFVLECKNLFGNIEINSKGDFIRTIRCGGRYYKEGIYSPITQNQRHLQVLNECRNENHGKVMAALRNHWFSNFFKGLVVLSNPKTIINDQDAPQEVKKQVIRADQLVETIKRMNRESSELKSSMKDLKEDGEYYLNNHLYRKIQAGGAGRPACRRAACTCAVGGKILSEVRQAACHAGGQTRHTYRRKILGLHRISSMSFYKENRENRKQINRKAA